MGNDGGSIPKRRELVKEAARLPSASELRATALESLAHAWSTCPISSSPLDPHNTVSDARGRLYNYETVLRCLMPGEPTTDDNGGDGDEQQQSQEAIEFARSGIRSLKDVVKLRFNIRRQARQRDEKRGISVDSIEDVRTCPLSMKELGPATRAVYVVPCGHVFAEMAIKELKIVEEGDAGKVKASTTDTTTTDKEEEKTSSSSSSSSSRCPECSEPFLPRDLVPVLPVDEADVEICASRIEALRALGLAHNLKKDKTKKRKAADGGVQEEGEVDGEGKKEKKQKKKTKKDRDDISSRINNSMTATLTAKVLAEQDERNRQRKLAAAMAR